ncbi:MAG TPA: thioesterase [Bacteroidales bacterium]|nr:thioesterase [Bacteroidales bacterium]
MAHPISADLSVDPVNGGEKPVKSLPSQPILCQELLFFSPMSTPITEKYTLKFPALLTTADVDMEGRLRPGALVNLLVQGAIRSAEQLRVGFGILREQDLYWVLHRLTVEADRLPGWHEEVILETWPKDIDGLLYLRDFFLWDPAGKTAARATSGWLAIHRDSKRPGLVESPIPGLFTEMRKKHAIELPPEKLKPVAQGEVSEIPALWTDFDINRHVTSSRYIDWMTDALPFDFLRAHRLRRLSVNFLKEVTPGDRICLTRRSDEMTHVFEGRRQVDGLPAFRGEMQFVPDTNG